MAESLYKKIYMLYKRTPAVITFDQFSGEEEKGEQLLLRWLLFLIKTHRLRFWPGPLGNLLIDISSVRFRAHSKLYICVFDLFGVCLGVGLSC